MNIVLPPEISSPEDCLELISAIKEYASALSRSSRLAHSDTPFRSDHLTEPGLAFLRLLPHNPQTPAALADVCSQLERAYDSAPKVGVVLAAPVTPPLRLELTTWFRTNLSPTALLTIQTNRNILGGIVVRYGSRIHDWSFRTALLSSERTFTEVARV